MPVRETVREFQRRRAVELIGEREPITTVAKYLGVCVPSIKTWVLVARSGGSLKTKACGGRPRVITDDQLATLRELLSAGASAHGWPNDVWSTPRVREMIQRHFGITYSRTHTWYLMYQYLNWTSQYPTTRIRDRNEELIARWPVRQFKRILKEATERNAYVAFVDEAGFMCAPTVKRTFSPRGVRPVVRLTNPHGRISTACAITLSPYNRRANVHFQMLPDNANYTGHSIATFLRLLRDKLDAPVIVVWDCIPIHTSKAVRAVLRESGNVWLRMLPKYAPELNPADKVWAYVKFSRLGNFAPPDLSVLRRTVKNELLAVKKRPRLLHSFIKCAGLNITVR
jgi:transposase